MLRVYVAAIGMMCVGGAIVAVRSADLGFEETAALDGRRTVTVVEPGGPAARAGLRVGDVVLEDPGGPWAARWSERDLGRHHLATARAVVAGSVRFVIDRDGSRRDVVVAPAPPSGRSMFRKLGDSLILYLVAAGYLGMAVVLAHNPNRDEPIRRLLAFGFATVAPAFALNSGDPTRPVWLVYWGAFCVNAGTVGFSAVLAAFAWTFPLRSPLVDRRWPRVAIVGGALIACAVSTAEGAQLAQTPLPGNQSQLLFDGVMLVLALGRLAWQRRRAPTELARRQASTILVPFAIAIGILIGLAAMEGKNPGVVHNPYLQNGLFLATLIIPLGMAAAVARYRLFDLDLFAPRAGVYVVVGAASLLIYAVVLGAVERLLGPVFGQASQVARWVAIPALVMAGGPIRNQATRALDRLFRRDPVRFIARSTELVARIGQAAAVTALGGWVREAFEVQVGEIVAPDGLGAAATAAVRDELRRKGVLRVLELRDRALVDQFLACGFEVLVDVPYGGRVVGLSTPLATGLLGPAERRALTQVGRAIAGAFERQAAHTSLARDAELARRQIAMELHDGVGATLAAAQLYVQQAKRRPGPADAPAPSPRLEPLDSLERTLSEGLTDLRLAVGTLAEDATGWSDVLAQIRRHMGDVCASAGLALEFAVQGPWHGDAPPAPRLAARRVLQEGLNNIVRHARARRVVCRLVDEVQTIVVELEDDGVGLPPDEARGSGRGLNNIARRVSAMHGTLALTRSALGGVRIAATIPIAPRLAPAGDPSVARPPA